MTSKLIALLCLTVYAIKALPQYTPGSTDTIAEKVEKLGLSQKDDVDYNQYILNLESIIEESQQVALDAIEYTVDIAQEFANGLAILGAHSNVVAINDIQSSYFKLFEHHRHEAYQQERDVSSCVYTAVQTLHNESKSSINEITVKLENITNIFSDYTTVNYIEPANVNMAKSYTIRERIYQCPFSFTDFTPFYLCLTVAAVLQDVIILNEFAIDFNNTATNVYNLAVEFRQAATLFQTENVDAFNSTAQSVYSEIFRPCAADNGFIV